MRSQFRFRVMGTGLAIPVTATLILALRGPVAAGSNVTLSMQFEFAGTDPAAYGDRTSCRRCCKREVGQISARDRDAGDTQRSAPPLLVIITVCAVLVVATRWVLKLSVVVESVSVGGVTPVPDRVKPPVSWEWHYP